MDSALDRPGAKKLYKIVRNIENLVKNIANIMSVYAFPGFLLVCLCFLLFFFFGGGSWKIMLLTRKTQEHWQNHRQSKKKIRKIGKAQFSNVYVWLFF